MTPLLSKNQHKYGTLFCQNMPNVYICSDKPKNQYIMKKITLLILTILTAIPSWASVQNSLQANIESLPIIPRPQKVTAQSGVLTQEKALKVNAKIDKKMAPEAYVLEVTPKGIRVKAGSKKGVFYARMSLAQLQETGQDIPCMTIEDEPRFGYRGFMLDVSRHFFSV